MKNGKVSRNATKTVLVNALGKASRNETLIGELNQKNETKLLPKY